MLTINTNLPSLNAQRRLSASQGGLARALERLSSGLRVNSARDDAAGLAIATRMTAEIRSSAQIQRGINDGISLVQVADGGLSQTHALLQRLRELAVQAANGTWSASDRAAIGAEARELIDEIDRTANFTQIFGTYPLKSQSLSPPNVLGSVPHLNATFPTSGSGGNFTSGLVPLGFIPEGSENVTIDINSFSIDDDLQLFTRSGLHLVGTPIGGSDGDEVWNAAAITDAPSMQATVLTQANGFNAGASYDGSQLFDGPPSYAYPPGATATVTVAGTTLRYSGDGDRYQTGPDFNDGLLAATTRESLTIERANEDLLLMVAGGGNFSAAVSWDFMPPPGVVTPDPSAVPTRILMSASAGQPLDFHEVEGTPADAVTLGISDLDLTTATSAASALARLDQALNTVSGYRARYGAHMSIFERAIDALSVAHENLSAARSRIMDADYAAETAALAKHQILQQAGTAMLAQANQLPQQVLALLRS